MAGTDSDGYSALGGLGYAGFALAVDKQWFPASIGTEFPTTADSALYTPQTDIPGYTYPDAYRIPLTPAGATVPSTTRLAKIFQLDFGPDDRLIDRLCWWLDQLCFLHNILPTPDLLKHDGNAASVLAGTNGETAPYEMTERRWAHWDLYKRIRQRIVNVGLKLGIADASRSDFWAVGEYATNGKPQGDKYPLAHQGQSNRFHWMPAWAEADIDAWDAYGKIDRRNFTRMFPARVYPLMPQFWTYHATKRSYLQVPLTQQRTITTNWIYDTVTWEPFWILQKFCELAVDTIANFNSAPPGAVISQPSGGSGSYVFASWFDPYAYINGYATGTQYADTLAAATAWGVATAAANITGIVSGLPTYMPGSDGTSPNSSTTDAVEAANIPFPGWTEAFNAYAAASWVCYPATNDHWKTDTIAGGIATGSSAMSPYLSTSILPSGIASNLLADVENTFMRMVKVVGVGEGTVSDLPKELDGWEYRVQSSFVFSLCHVDGSTLRQKFGFQTSGAELRSVVTSTLGFLVDGNSLPPSYWNLSNLWGTVVTDRYDPTRGTTPLLQPDLDSPNTWYWSQPMRQGGRINTRQNPFSHSIKYTYGWIDYTPDAANTTPSSFPDDSICRNGIDSNAICAAIVDAIQAGVDTTVLGTVTPSYGVQTTAFDVETMLDAEPPEGKGMFFLAIHCDPIEFPAVPSILPTDLANVPASDPLWHNFLNNHDITKERDITGFIDTSANSGQYATFTRYDGTPITSTGVYNPADVPTSTGLTYAAHTLAMQTFTDDWERIALQSYIWGVRATANGYNGSPQSGIYTPFGYWRMNGTADAFAMAVGGSCTLYDPYFNWVTLGHLTGLTDRVYGPHPFWYWCNKEMNYRQTGNM